MPENSAGMCFASAISETRQTDAAIEHVLAEIDQQIRGRVDLVVAFVTGHHIAAFDTIHRRLSRALSPKAMLGSTAAGVIGRQWEVEAAAGLSVLAARLPGAQIKPFDDELVDWPTAAQSPVALSQMLEIEDIPPKAMIMIADPFSTPITHTLPTLERHCPGLPVVGGMASAASKPGGNRLLVNDKIRRQGMVGMTLSGNICLDCTISQGCRPIGKPLVITKSHRHIVYELGGHGVLSVIHEMVSDLNAEDRLLVQTRGLMIGRVINEYKERFGRGDFLIRHLLAVDQEAGYVAINDPQIRTGQTVQFHVHDQKTAAEDFKLLLEGQKLHGSASGALLFSCNGRGTHLFDQPHTDARMVHEALGDVPLAGFFAAGEIGPIGHENFLHGHTASLILFRQEQAHGRQQSRDP